MAYREGKGNVQAQRRRYRERKKKFSPYYVDSKGYLRYKKDKVLVHRRIAFNDIYLKNRDRYDLPFSCYQVHHLDKNIRNNHPFNLELVPVKDHEKIHGITSKHKWEWKKERANQKDFSVVRLLFGERRGDIIVRLSFLIFKISLILGLIFVMAGFVFSSDILRMLGYVSFGVLLLNFVLMIIFFIIGLIHNHSRNVWEELKDIFRK